MAEPRTEAWADRLVKAERENRCGDLACQTRRTSAAVAVLTGWKEHQDLCWAVEAFQVETGQRDPATVGREPESIPSRAAIEAEAFERGRLFAITGSGTQQTTDLIREAIKDERKRLAGLVEGLEARDCPDCHGDGWTAETTADPDEAGEPGEPYQYQHPCAHRPLVLALLSEGEPGA